MAYTREQIYEAMRRADKAGDAESVRALARHLKTLPTMGKTETPPNYETLKPDQAQGAIKVGERQLEQKTAKLSPRGREDAKRRFYADPRIKALKEQSVEEPSGLEQLGKSAANVVTGLAQGAAQVTYDPLQQFASGVERYAVQGLGKAGGGVLDMLGLEKAGDWWRRGAEGADRDLAQDRTASGALEKLYPTPEGMEGSRLAAQFVGGMMVPMGGKGKVLPSFPKEVTSGPARIVAEGAKNKVRVLTTDLKPPKTFIGKSAQSMGERIPLAGTGSTRAAQQAERVEAVKGVLREFGGDDVVQLFDDAPTAVDDVAKSLTAQRGKELTRLTGDKKAVIDKFDDAVPVPKALQAIDEQIARLEAIGTPEIAPVVTKLQGWKQALGGKSLRNIEELRKIMGQAFDDPGLAGIKDTGQKAVNAIYDPLRQDMGNFIRSQGGAADFTKWSNANQKLAEMAGELNNTTLRNVLKTSEMTPENVGKLLFSRNRSDVARLYENLDDFGKSRAQAAVLQKAFDKSISAESGLSVERFVNNVTALGDSVGVVFKGPELARVEGLVKLLDATRRAATASVAPPTGVQNVPIVGGIALTQLAGLWGGAAIGGAGGLFARAYESAPVRNALLKLAKAPKGTVAESKALERTAKVLMTTIGSQKGNIEAAMMKAVPLRAAAGEGEEDQQNKQPALQP